MAIIEIKNEELNIKISTMGAELISVRGAGGREFLHDGDPAVWGWHAPILFPVCGDLNGGRYTYKGKEYLMKRHGFARDMEFSHEPPEQGVTTDCAEEPPEAGGKKRGDMLRASFVLESGEETFAVYPFDFLLKVIYTLDENRLNVKYVVENRTDGDMYFSIGSHEGYACPEGLEGYSAFLDEIVPLIYDYFEGEEDTLVYEEPEFTSVTLKHFSEDSFITVDFGEVPSFSIWTKPGAKFVCLEPWHGKPETQGADPDITKKPGFIKLGEGEVFETSHTITFYEK